MNLKIFNAKKRQQSFFKTFPDYIRRSDSAVICKTIFLLVLLFGMYAGSGLYAQSVKTHVANNNEIIISGRVRDPGGEFAPGVTIGVKGTDRFASTNDRGEFTIKVPGKQSILVFKSISYETSELPVGNRTNIDITMKTHTSALNEYVVIGYDRVKRSDATMAVSRVSTKGLNEKGVSNIQEFLAGKAPGVRVTQDNGGEPGGGISIVIRGMGSLGGSSQPLYVIDGVPLDMPNVSALSTNGNSFIGAGSNSVNPITAINPNDIESIDILKDAAATAIYGSRGSNGVVLITTKAGKTGKPRLTIGVNRALSTSLKNIDVLSAKDYANFVNEAYFYKKYIGYNTALKQPYLPSEIENLKTYDHQRELQKVAPTTDLNASLSGGNDLSKYYLSGQYFDQHGIIGNTRLKRYNFKISYDNNISSRLKFNTNLTLTGTGRTGIATSSIKSAIGWAPSSPFINPDGTFNQVNNFYYGDAYVNDSIVGSLYYNPRFDVSTVRSYIGTNALGANPLNFSSKNGQQNENTNFQLLGNASLIYKVSEDLNVTGQFSLTSYDARLQNYIPSTFILPYTTAAGVASLGNSQNYKLLYQLSANYRHEFTGGHTLTGVLVGTAEKFESQTQSTSSMGFTSDGLGFYGIQAGATPDIPKSTYDGYQLVSSIARLAYDYKGLYYLTASGRYDGSSKFADGSKFGFFPSLSVSWRIDNEKWFRNIFHDAISDFKLRASWGLVGNQSISSYSTLSTLTAAITAFGGHTATSFAPSRLPNNDLRWEKTQSYNIGADLSFLKGRIAVTAEVYRRRTSDLLYNVSIPNTSGFSSMIANIATLKNEGLEFGVNTINVKSNNWRWTTDFNISFNRNMVEKLTGSAGDYINVENVVGSAFLFRVVPGEALGQFFGYRTIGVWTDKTILEKPATFQAGVKEGSRRYADINNDKLLTDADRVYLGSALPRFDGGFANSVGYRQFELAATFSYSVGNKIFNYGDMNVTGMGGFNNIKKAVYNKRYRIIYPDTDPKLAEEIRKNNETTKVSVPGTLSDARESTDYYIEDGSFLRCRDISLTYIVPAKLLSKLRLQSFRAYINLQNPFTITRYSGLNPEVNTSGGLAMGVDNGSYPMGRSYRFGFTIGL